MRTAAVSSVAAAAVDRGPLLRLYTVLFTLRDYFILFDILKVSVNLCIISRSPLQSSFFPAMPQAPYKACNVIPQAFFIFIQNPPKLLAAVRAAGAVRLSPLNYLWGQGRYYPEA